MEIVKFVYSDQEIEFELGESSLMVNATEMAKVFGKRVDHFLKSDHAKEFINVLELTPFGGRPHPLKRDEIIKTVNGLNTWMHRILALKFAAWLDTTFELWVYTTIDKLINQHFKEQREALIERLTAKQKRELKKQEILEKYSDKPDILEYFELEKIEKEAKRKQLASVREQVKQLSFSF